MEMTDEQRKEMARATARGFAGIAMEAVNGVASRKFPREQIAKMSNTISNEDFREITGSESTTDPLVTFIYLLLRDHLPAGVVEKIVMDAQGTHSKPNGFTNGHLARYAKLCAARLHEGANVRIVRTCGKATELMADGREGRSND